RLPLGPDEIRAKGHLREQQVGTRPDCEGTGGGTTSVELPVPECENDDVCDPDRAAGEQQIGAVADAFAACEVITRRIADATLAADSTAISSRLAVRSMRDGRSMRLGFAAMIPIRSTAASPATTQ